MPPHRYSAPQASSHHNSGHSPNPSLGPDQLAGHQHPPLGPAVYSTTALGVNVLIPKFVGGIFPYRDQITARLSLTGTVLLQYRDVVLGPVPPNESQMVLWCYAECSSCTSSQHPQCSPVGFYLVPLRDQKHNQGFRLDPFSGTLTGNVTFAIQHRPRVPKEQDQTRRCASESLMLTFSLRDYVGHTVAEAQVGPFRARSHIKKVRQIILPPQQADVPHPLPVNTQTPSSVLPVKYTYIWADVRATASTAPSRAHTTPSQLPVDATQGGIVPATTRGARLSMQPEQQPLNIANSGRGQASPLPVVTANSPPPAWNTPKTTQAQLPGIYETADVPPGVQYPEAPEKPGKRKQARNGVEDDGGGGTIAPDLPGLGVENTLSFGGPPGGGTGSNGGVIPPPSPRHGGGPGFDRSGWGQGRSTKSGTATPWNISQSGTSVALDLPPIEIVSESPGRGLVPNIEGWQTTRTLSHPLPAWTEKIAPSPLHTTTAPPVCAPPVCAPPVCAPPVYTPVYVQRYRPLCPCNDCWYTTMLQQPNG